MKTGGKGEGQLLLGVLATLKKHPTKPHYGVLISPKEVCCTSFLHQHNCRFLYLTCRSTSYASKDVQAEVQAEAAQCMMYRRL